MGVLHEMVVRKRRKTRKLRGRTRTMSWGRIGQHRKSGSRGGRGAAGLGKHEWTWTIKYAPSWFGKHGFNPPRIRVGYRPKHLNIDDLVELIEKLSRKGGLAYEGDVPVINLAEMGYHKLLGNGKITRPVKVIVPEASEQAVKKIEGAGGTVELLAPREE